MKNIIQIVLLVVVSATGFTQNNINNSWPIGTWGYTVNFSNSPYQHDTTWSQTILYPMGKSSICDSNGNILIKSNGMELFHGDGSLMDNGAQLVDDTFYTAWGGAGAAPVRPQGSIILPMENGIYYFIQTTCNDTNYVNRYLNGLDVAPSNILQYSIIDMKLNAGQGKVTARMIPLLENVALENTQMMACRHGNGKDWWLFKMAADSNKLYCFLFTQDSVYNKGVQHIPFSRQYKNGGYGQMMFNADGTKFVTTGIGNFAKVFTADFDRCYGLLSNFSELTMPCPTWEDGIDSTTHGVVFSPNGRFLYVAHIASIYQYDTWDNGWYKVCDKDTSYDYFAWYSNLQITSDGKILIGHRHGISKQLSLIENPNEKGVGCNFCRKCLRAKSTTGWLTGPPNVANYALGAKTCWPLNQSESQEPSEEQWKVFPNPASTEVTLQWSSLPSVTTLITISDMMGRVRKMVEVAPRTNNVVIPVADLEFGVYVVELKQEGKTWFTEKLIVK